MSALYSYIFGEEVYRVDDSGTRHSHFEREEDDTVFCESCGEKITHGFEDEFGRIITCEDCWDITAIDLRGKARLLLDDGRGMYRLTPSLAYIEMEIVERHTDGEVHIKRGSEVTVWRTIMAAGTVVGYQYVGDVD